MCNEINKGDCALKCVNIPIQEKKKKTKIIKALYIQK